MAKISGTVQKEGSPLERAYVRCVGPSGEFVAEEYTAVDGAFEFHVAEGAWTLEVRAAGIETKSQRVEISGDQDVKTDISVA
jgi:hypothetical protein